MVTMSQLIKDSADVYHEHSLTSSVFTSVISTEFGFCSTTDCSMNGHGLLFSDECSDVASDAQLHRLMGDGVLSRNRVIFIVHLLSAVSIAFT